MSIDSVKRKLDSMLSDIDEEDERELEDFIQVRKLQLFLLISSSNRVNNDADRFSSKRSLIGLACMCVLRDRASRTSGQPS
jgi:hypothetical protein